MKVKNLDHLFIIQLHFFLSIYLQCKIHLLHFAWLIVVLVCFRTHKKREQLPRTVLLFILYSKSLTNSPTPSIPAPCASTPPSQDIVAPNKQLFGQQNTQTCVGLLYNQN